MTAGTEKMKAFFRNKTVHIVLVCLLALLLLFAAYKVFAAPTQKSGYTPTEREERVIMLLEELDGVDGATVMITEEESVPVSAIVVFRGEDGFLVRMKVRQIAATALGIEEKNVVVYPTEK